MITANQPSMNERADQVNGKWIYLGQRNPRLTREQFHERWLKHRTTLGAPPEMGAEFVTADYCAVLSDAVALKGISDEYDGVGVFVLEDLSSIPVLARFLKYDFIQADEKRFFNGLSVDFSIFGAEEVVHDGADAEVALLHFVRRNAVTPRAEFFSTWRRDCEQAWAAGLGQHATRMVINPIIAPQPAGHAYDLVMETRFNGIEGINAAAATLDQLWLDSSVIEQRHSFVLATRIIAARPRKRA